MIKTENEKKVVSDVSSYVEGVNTFHFTFDVWKFPIHKFSSE